MNKHDEKFLRLSFKFARKARDSGNHPFGALLVDASGEIILAAENSTLTQHDATAHAEMNLMRAASRGYEPALLRECTVYASAEPCPMCAAAIVWGNVRRVVYGLSMQGIYAAISKGGNASDAPGLAMHASAVTAAATVPVEIIGPMLEDEAAQVHAGFWRNSPPD